MNYKYWTHVLAMGLTIFTMWLGVGSLIFPVCLGIASGGMIFTGFLGFVITGVLLPILSLVAIIAFDGDYNAYFARLGRISGKTLIFLCMAFIGPLVVMPRTIGLSYALLQPLVPSMSITLFSALFASLSFLMAYRPGSVLDVMGKIFGPLKILSLILVIMFGLWGAPHLFGATPVSFQFFLRALVDGYQTLDVIAVLFLGAVIMRFFVAYNSKTGQINPKVAMSLMTYSALLAGLLISMIYLGFFCMGTFYGDGLCGAFEGDIFRMVALRSIGGYGAAIMGSVIFIVGMSSVVSLAVVLGDYLNHITGKKLSYAAAVASVLAITVLVSLSGLSNILYYSRPILSILCPLIIVTTVCNLLYKGLGFTWIKLPVFVTALVSAWLVLF